jgi:hypothetical protein
MPLQRLLKVFYEGLIVAAEEPSMIILELERNSHEAHLEVIE